MKFGLVVLSALTAVSSGFTAARLNHNHAAKSVAFAPKMSTATEAEADAETKEEGKKAGEDTPPVNIGWNSHTAVVSFCSVLVYVRESCICWKSCNSYYFVLFG